MAHIGKLYKLQFRRDLANVTDNRNAYPEAMLFKEDNMDGPIGLAIGAHRVLLVNVAKNNQPPMKWVSSPATVAGVTYTVTFSLSDPFDTSSTNVDLQVVNVGTGAILMHWSSGPPMFGNAPARMANDGGTVITQTPLCNIPSTIPSWEYDAAGWTAYNP